MKVHPERTPTKIKAVRIDLRDNIRAVYEKLALNVKQ